MASEATVNECIDRLIKVGCVAPAIFHNDNAGPFRVERYSDRWEWGVRLSDEFGGWDMITLRYQSSVREQVETMGGEVC